jgi:hypothetical protein
MQLAQYPPEDDAGLGRGVDARCSVGARLLHVVTRLNRGGSPRGSACCSCAIQFGAGPRDAVAAGGKCGLRLVLLELIRGGGLEGARAGGKCAGLSCCSSSFEEDLAKAMARSSLDGVRVCGKWAVSCCGSDWRRVSGD